ncbi:hypothetical protein [Pukyongiella litopenaei]|uniref:Uncharacterized protein n=1 Tax=Pukyongiella litopenaei TaxID=2605946 RepID=A0A2S0MRH7_9RHOB|nr:hypothetical protein [Pukyongiella litopenaei]AVO38351.1 hypothetical protein C6Y53_12060 [Pukyongiella litopenaei]
MSLIRPEARAALWRWREVLAGGAALALGTSWVAGPGGLLGWVGWIVVLAGAALVLAGVQRARFRFGGGGPGLVQVDEGRVVYFGPLGGGSVDVADLAALDYDPRSHPPVWVLCQRGRPEIFVPITADGAEALFDVFSALPGLQIETLIRDRDRAGSRVRLWQRPDRQVAVRGGAGG